MSWSLTVDFVSHFLLDHLLRQQVAAQVFTHVRRGEVAALELRQERVLWNVGLRIKVGLVELGVRQFDLERLSLLEQELLDNQLVEQIQLGGQGFFFRRLLAGAARRYAFSTSSRVISLPLTTAQAFPDGAGGCAGRAIAARGGQDCQGKDESDSGHLYIVAAASPRTDEKHWTAQLGVGRA